MNILVTGANGQLGNEIQIVSKQTTTHNFVFTDVCDGYRKLDITNLDDVRQIVKEENIDCIINCAAWTNVDAAEDPEKAELVEMLNATAPENLAKAMKEVGGLLVHISTDYVFGKEPYNIPCKEDQKGTPTGVYGATKLMGEQRIQKVFSDVEDENAGGYVIIRTAWLYSEFGKNFCKTMLSLTATKPQLKVVFDQCGTPTYALDLAEAIMKMIEKPVTGIYHYSNEGVCSWYDFTKMIQQIAVSLETPETFATHGACEVLPCHSDEFPSPVKRPAYSVLDKTKIKQTYGIEIPYWTDSLKKCIKNIQY